MLHNFDLALGALRGEAKKLSPNEAHDVAIGLARASESLPSDLSNPLSVRRAASNWLFDLANMLESNAEVTRLICTLVQECTSLAVAGMLICNTFPGAETNGDDPSRSYNVDVIQRTFDVEVSKRLRANPGALFDLPDDDIQQVLFSTKETTITREICLSALNARPEMLPRLLGHAIALNSWAGTASPVAARVDNLASLHQRLDLELVHQATKHLETTFWRDPNEQERVRQFRARLPAVISRSQAPG